MSRLANPEASELCETKALRERRDHLLRKANRARYRLHCRPDLTRELQQATNDLLKHELQARRRPEPLGDAGAAGQPHRIPLPYKD